MYIFSVFSHNLFLTNFNQKSLKSMLILVGIPLKLFYKLRTMNNQQKQQEHLSLFKHYIQGLNEIKKDLETIKKLTDQEEKYNQANLNLAGHSTKYSLASGHYNTGKLWEISGCNQSSNEYAQLVNELRTIETETFKQLKATQCAYCQKKYLTLIKQLSSLLAKAPNLSAPEQQKITTLSQEADNFTERLKRKQVKTQQQQKTSWVLWVCGGLVGLGLIGLVIWLMVRKRKG
ncbi:MAG: hypothetical protein MRECE_38c015 [Mycoplasmataceae bacterium CE_OT135]|nr:MAG: hypothetical protein MRECE_38c015 [Mycoplasmataceae bacterium CE_OT135]